MKFIIFFTKIVTPSVYKCSYLLLAQARSLCPSPAHPLPPPLLSSLFIFLFLFFFLFLLLSSSPLPPPFPLPLLSANFLLILRSHSGNLYQERFRLDVFYHPPLKFRARSRSFAPPQQRRDLFSAAT